METELASGIIVTGQASPGNGHAAALSELSAYRVEHEFLQERLIELEMALAADSHGWLPLGGMDGTEFSRDALRDICKQARLFYLKNPLIRRGVDAQRYYVFGQGVTVRAVDEEVNEFVQAFMDDAQNRAEFTSHQARMLKEIDLRLFGNIFFVFFVDDDARVLVRTIPVGQVDDIVCNPEDARDPWFYLRRWAQTDIEGQIKERKVAYPDWRYTGSGKPTEVRGYTVDWEHPVYHVKTGGLGDMRFGVPETYPAHDWARAYTRFLEDWATLTRAHSRFAHQLTVPGRAGIADAQTRLGTTLGSNGGETNPPPVTGATFVSTPGTSISPVRIGGANVSMDDGRRMLLMVAAALGLPETFFGDTQVGALATARSLDRPTELQMRDRQTMWASVHRDILDYVVQQAIEKSQLAGRIEQEPDGTPAIELPPDEEGNPRDASVTVEFPAILEHDVVQQIEAIVDAGTLKGSSLSGLIDAQTMSRLLLIALGVDDVDSLMDDLYPEDGEDADGEGMIDDDEERPTVEEFAAALREVRAVLAGMATDA